jgi:hypothetical protein
MKSYRFYLIVLISLIAISLKGQVFVGGNFGFNSASNKAQDGATITHKDSNYRFSLSPYGGIFLSEKFALGIELDLSLNGSKAGVNLVTSNKSLSVGVSPFVRYYALKWNKLSLFGQGNIGVEYTWGSIKTGGVTDDTQKTTRLYFSVYPGLAYDITEKLSLQTSINVLSLGFSHANSKDDTEKYVSSSFNFGAGLGNIVSLNTITIGAIYKF